MKPFVCSPYFWISSQKPALRTDRNWFLERRSKCRHSWNIWWTSNLSFKKRPVDELHKLFQAPETAFTDAQDCLKENHTDNLFELKLHLNDRIVSAFFLEFVLNVLQHQADHLDDRDDQGAKSQGARVVPGCVMTLSSRLILTWLSFRCLSTQAGLARQTCWGSNTWRKVFEKRSEQK